MKYLVTIFCKSEIIKQYRSIGTIKDIRDYWIGEGVAPSDIWIQLIKSVEE